MIGPFVMMPMCDCRIDRKTKKKVCTPFLRAFEHSCNGIKVIGNFDYDGNVYTPRGEVSSEAKCCDCCVGEAKATEVCYDLACLLRREERNGGLENISIVDGSGVPGKELHFNPPVNSAQDIASQMNGIAYLGLTTWHASATKKGFLCVSVPAGTPLPGKASGIRFRRFRTTNQNSGLGLGVAGSNYGTYWDLQDALSVGSPAADGSPVADPILLSSHIHYLCKLSTTQLTVAEPFSTGTLQHQNLFRSEFPDNSTAFYFPSPPNAPLPWLNAWATGENITTLAGRQVWASKLQTWTDEVLRSGGALTFGTTKSYVQIGSTPTPVPNFDFTVYPATLVVDVPCNIELVSMYTLRINSDGSELSPAGIIPTNVAANHVKFFAEDVGSGYYGSTPYIDGVGGSVSWSRECEIPGPFDVGAFDASSEVFS